MKSDMKLVCEKCGKEAEVDKERSNENWTVYKTKCECGGKITMKFD